MNEEARYSPLVARLFREAPGAGRPDGPGWLSGEAREPLSGTHVRVHLLRAGASIAGVCYEVRGCPHTIAATALIAADLDGRPWRDPELDFAALALRLEAPASKLGRFFVIQDAIRAALLTLERGSA
jgi:hypothetical protein